MADSISDRCVMGVGGMSEMSMPAEEAERRGMVEERLRRRGLLFVFHVIVSCDLLVMDILL
jgi:hypothetical protein